MMLRFLDGFFIRYKNQRHTENLIPNILLAWQIKKTAYFSQVTFLHQMQAEGQRFRNIVFAAVPLQ
jgi:hypothetical protein